MRLFGVEIVEVYVEQREQVAEPEDEVEKALLFVIGDHDIAVEQSLVQAQRRGEEVEIFGHVAEDKTQKEDHDQTVIVENDSLFLAFLHTFQQKEAELLDPCVR